MELGSKLSILFGFAFFLFVTSGLASPIVVDSNQDSSSGRIAGGVEAIPHEFPWQVSLEWAGGPVCGGVIVNQSIVLTSASCADLVTISSIYIYTGRHQLNDTVGDTVKKLSVQKIIVHPYYPGGVNGLSNDIAIFKLVYPIEFNTEVQPILIAQPGQDFPDTAIITGWGSKAEEAIMPSNSLMKATVPIISDSECELIYGEDFERDSMICAGDLGLDFCTGDDGGPLIAQAENGAYYLIGISSWGYGCGKPGFPGVFTEVSNFFDFIQQNV